MEFENNEQKAKKYSKIKVLIFLLSIFLSIALLGLFQIFFSLDVRNLAVSISSNFYISCLIFSCIFLLFMYVGTFAIHFISSYVVEHKFSLSKQTLGAWALDEIKSDILSFSISILCILVFYFILRVFPGTWWLISALAWFFISVVLARLTTVIIIPLFYKYSSIDDKGLKNKILSLAKKTKLNLVDVCQIDFSKKTTKANAMLAGLGKTRKVILSDTLIDNFTHEEIETVVAHELGHYKYKHIFQLLIFSGVITGASFFAFSFILKNMVIYLNATGVSDIYMFPIFVLFLTIFGLLFSPIQNLFSRKLEKEADLFAIDETTPDALISVMDKLGDMNLANRSPSFLEKMFLYDHPPITERIQMAEDIKKKG